MFAVEWSLLDYLMNNKTQLSSKFIQHRYCDNDFVDAVDHMCAGGILARTQSLFCLAWFHAVCQERRNYIPQVIPKNINIDLSSNRSIILCEEN